MQKEERAHDDRINSANMRIKQASGLEFSFQYFDETYIRKGQTYEKKKSKKSAQDASDEYARYINLISTLGPEISQVKSSVSLYSYYLTFCLTTFAVIMRYL